MSRVAGTVRRQSSSVTDWVTRLRMRPDARARRLRRRLAEEDGQVLLLFALATVVLIGFLALAIDVGGWFASDRNLQKGADSAAVAGAQRYAYQLIDQPVPATNPCVNALDGPTCASSVAALNGVATDGTPTLTPDPTNPNNTAMTVKVKDATPPNSFATFFGIHPTIRRSATATVGPTGGGGNVMPFAFTNTEALGWHSGQTIPYTFSGGSGTFGLLTLGGTCGGASASDVAGCINPRGCQCSLIAPTTVPQSTGNKWNSNGVKSAFQTLKNMSPQPTVLVPVYDTITSGNYHVIGFAGFIVTDYSVVNPGQIITLTGRFVGTVNGTLCSGSCQSFGSFAVAMTG